MHIYIYYIHTYLYNYICIYIQISLPSPYPPLRASVPAGSKWQAHGVHVERWMSAWESWLRVRFWVGVFGAQNRLSEKVGSMVGNWFP